VEIEEMWKSSGSQHPKRDTRRCRCLSGFSSPRRLPAGLRHGKAAAKFAMLGAQRHIVLVAVAFSSVGARHAVPERATRTVKPTTHSTLEVFSIELSASPQMARRNARNPVTPT
jgi:hypothetical protein